MKVLIVAAYPVVPLSHGGRVRTFRLAAAMARAGAHVDVLCPWSPDQPLRPFVRDSVHIQPHLFAANALLTLPDSWLPSVIALSWQPFALGPRRRLRAASKYDVIQFELCAYGAWMERLASSARVVYSSHNVEADFFQNLSSDTFLHRRYHRMVTSLERRSARASDLIVTCTEADASRMADLYSPSAPTVVIPNGFEDSLLGIRGGAERARARASLGIERDELALLYVGGGAEHNCQAVQFVQSEVLPRLDARARLIVVGKSARGLAEGDGRASIPLGYVQDLRGPLAAADVAVNPASYGAGSSLKMAEYLAAGLQVVSTPVGIRGFERYRDLVWVAELDEFPAAVERAAEAPKRTAEIEELSWSRLGARLHDAYRELLGGGLGPGGSDAGAGS